MDNILDDILAIANGGCTAEKIQAFIAWEDSRVGMIEGAAREIYNAALKNGLQYIIHPEPNTGGYSFTRMHIPGYAAKEEVYRSMHIQLDFGTASAPQVQLGEDRREYKASLPVWAGMAEVTTDNNTIVLTLQPSNLRGYTLDKLNKLPVEAYVGKTLQELKQHIQLEVTKSLTGAYYDNPSSASAAKSLFFTHDFFMYSSRDRLHRLNKSSWLNLIKLLYPTVVVNYKTNTEICRQIIDSALIPRDFGITNLDTLLELYAGLLSQKMPSDSKLQPPRISDYTQASLVNKVLEAGGTLDGGKVGSRKNFKKKEDKVCVEEVA